MRRLSADASTEFLLGQNMKRQLDFRFFTITYLFKYFFVGIIIIIIIAGQGGIRGGTNGQTVRSVRPRLRRPS